MMPKISNGKTFGGIVSYANDILNKDTEVLASRGVDLTSNYTIKQSFRVQAQMNRRLEKCVGHFALAFPKEDAHRCTNGFMRKLAIEYMNKMGIVNTQFVIFRHRDRDHDHVHVVYNRIDNNGKTISDSCDVERAIAICQAMTRHYGLHWSDGKVNVNRSRLKGKDKVKYAIYDAAMKVLQGSHTWKDFIEGMEKEGIQVKIAPRTNGSGLGITFVMGKVSLSGTQVDRRSLNFKVLNYQLGGIMAVTSEDMQAIAEEYEMDRHITYEKFDPSKPAISFDQSDEYVSHPDIEHYNDGDSDFGFDPSLAVGVANAAVAMVDAATTIAPSTGGGGGSSNNDLDDDDDEKKKKRKTFKR